MCSSVENTSQFGYSLAIVNQVYVLQKSLFIPQLSLLNQYEFVPAVEKNVTAALVTMLSDSFPH